jgi:hypothetical protein
MIGAPTALYYHEPSRRVFCGCDSGLLHVKKTEVFSCFFLLDDFIFVGISCC